MTLKESGRTLQPGRPVSKRQIVLAVTETAKSAMAAADPEAQ
jgi:hypothetical protein